MGVFQTILNWLRNFLRWILEALLGFWEQLKAMFAFMASVIQSVFTWMIAAPSEVIKILKNVYLYLENLVLDAFFSSLVFIIETFGPADMNWSQFEQTLIQVRSILADFNTFLPIDAVLECSLLILAFYVVNFIKKILIQALVNLF